MSALWITEQDVVDLLDLEEAIDALDSGLRQLHGGRARTMAKTHLEWDNGSTLHAIGGAYLDDHLVGTKSWAHTPGGATPFLTIWNSSTGALEAIIEAFALGQMRTGGTSGLATRYLAPKDARSLALIGAGKQALMQAAAVIAVRPIEVVRIFSRSAEKRERVAEELSKTYPGIQISAVETVEAAADGVEVVTLVTRAREAIFHSRMAAAGAHINAVGAITPEREELAQDVFPRARILCVDDPETARRLARELVTYIGEDGDWGGVASLGAVVSGTVQPPKGDLSIFKAMGMGVSDMALGVEILRRARAENAGRPIHAPRRAKPRLISASQRQKEPQ